MSSPQSSSWDAVAGLPDPSGYLDPLVAQQKREVYRQLVRRWLGSTVPGRVMKTDLFEEAFGEDRVLFDLVPGAAMVVGMDTALRTVEQARSRAPQQGFGFVATDVRRLAFRDGAFDLVFSNSTLDHFPTKEELRVSLRELVRTLQPGGLLIIALDNPWNPLYWPLCWATRRGAAPFVLGRTASMRTLQAWLRELGLEIEGQDWLIHNPRIVSTLLFLGLRRVFGRSADGIIRLILGLFAALGRLPTRPLSACFLAVCARKPLPRTPTSETEAG